MPKTEKRNIVALADALHSAAIHLLRQVRAEDRNSGIGPAQLSALSVLVFGGSMSLRRLAAMEQVKPPTMVRIVRGLVERGLVVTGADASDARKIKHFCDPARTVADAARPYPACAGARRHAGPEV